MDIYLLPWVQATIGNLEKQFLNKKKGYPKSMDSLDL
jgi:hypothetical protein